MITDLNAKAKNAETLKQNTEHLHDLGVGKDLLKRTQKAVNKRKKKT